MIEIIVLIMFMIIITSVAAIILSLLDCLLDNSIKPLGQLKYLVYPIYLVIKNVHTRRLENESENIKVNDLLSNELRKSKYGVR